MPAAGFALLPGPHDPLNASSVRIAQGTRVKLNLPGLVAPDKDAIAGQASRQGAAAAASNGDAVSSASPAVMKARRKLLKLQGIASQADSMQSIIIMDDGRQEAAGEAAGGSNGKPSALCSAVAVNSCSEPGGEGIDARGGQGGSSSKTGRPRRPRMGFKPSRSAAATSVTHAAITVGGSGSSSGGNSSSTANLMASGLGAITSGRRAHICTEQPPHVPIWERALPSLLPEERKPPPQPKVFQPVAVKTFSPTLGSSHLHGTV
jgi:hypothetical protein